MPDLDDLQQELEALTLTELRPIAKQLGVKGHSTLNKTPLIQAIIVRQKAKNKKKSNSNTVQKNKFTAFYSVLVLVLMALAVPKENWKTHYDRLFRAPDEFDLN